MITDMALIYASLQNTTVKTVLFIKVTPNVESIVLFKSVDLFIHSLKMLCLISDQLAWI